MYWTVLLKNSGGVFLRMSGKAACTRVLGPRMRCDRLTKPWRTCNEMNSHGVTHSATMTVATSSCRLTTMVTTADSACYNDSGNKQL